MAYVMPEVVQDVERMQIYKASEVMEGWIVRPVRGHSLDWTLKAAWWTHAVERIADGQIYLARPYGILHFGTVLLGCERYSVRQDSDMRFVRIKD